MQPNRGDINTKVTVSGVGFVRNGKVKLFFHADDMGEAPTDCGGKFSIIKPIPNPDFYAHFPNTQFDIHTTEYTSTGQYTGNGDSKPFYLTDRPSGAPGGGGQDNQPPPITGTTTTPGDPCPGVSAPVLTLQPNRGDINTKVTVSGVGFVRNGKVKLFFHADDMGEAPTDCGGKFSIIKPIPNPDFYAHFPNQQFDIHTTEYTATNQYTGNGDRKPFYLTD